MVSCPCCSQAMLMYARKGRTYWFCPTCHQEMPDLLNVMMTANQERHKIQSLSSSLLNKSLPKPADVV